MMASLSKVFYRSNVIVRCIGFCLVMMVFSSFVSCMQTNSSDTVLKRSSLSVCSMEKSDEFEFVKQHSEGVTIFDTLHKDIGPSSAKWNGYYDEDLIFFDPYIWAPIDGQKRIVGGTLLEFNIYDGEEGAFFSTNDSKEEEYDWNLLILPDIEFADFFNDALAISEPTEEWIKRNGQYVFQAEVTPDEHLYDNPWFPNINEDIQPDPLRLNKKVCVYGPYIRDKHHDSRPEIHPIDAIWWRDQSPNKDEFYLMSLQDDSNRFDDIGDFFRIPATPEFRPWSAFPMTTTFRIPFEYDAQHLDHLVLVIEELKALNIVTNQQPNSEDSDNDLYHKLVFDTDASSSAIEIQPSKVLIEVQENVVEGNNIGVTFQDVCLKPDGHVIGYVQITSSYGIKNGNEGYHVLKATLNYPINKIATRETREVHQ